MVKGFPEAINAVFPETIIQTCVVHLIRHSLEFVSWKDRKPGVPALRMIYQAKDADAGKAALDAFDAGPWGRKYPAIAQAWRLSSFAVSVRTVFFECPSRTCPRLRPWRSYAAHKRLKVRAWLDCHKRFSSCSWLNAGAARRKRRLRCACSASSPVLMISV